MLVTRQVVLRILQRSYKGSEIKSIRNRIHDKESLKYTLTLLIINVKRNILLSDNYVMITVLAGELCGHLSKTDVIGS